MGHGQGQGLELIVRVRVRFTVANCCIETAGEGDKMRISQVIKTDQWLSAISNADEQMQALSASISVSHY